MNFWNVDAGQIGMMLTFIGSAILVVRRLDRYAMEHEWLMDWYCKFHKLEKDKLVTRQKFGLFRGR